MLNAVLLRFENYKKANSSHKPKLIKLTKEKGKKKSFTSFDKQQINVSKMQFRSNPVTPDVSVETEGAWEC